MTTQQEGIFLPGLARAFAGIDARGELSTLQFAKACEAIMPVFDRLGTPSRHEAILCLENPTKTPALVGAQVASKVPTIPSLAQQCAQNLCRSSLRICKNRADCKGTIPIPIHLNTNYAGQAFAFAKKDMVVKVTWSQHVVFVPRVADESLLLRHRGSHWSRLHQVFQP